MGSKPKLGELLLQHKWISVEQLRDALANQLTIGGRLGTNLVEMGALTIEQLTRALGIQHGVPPAVVDQLENIQPSTLRQVQGAFCAAKGVLPLAIADQTLHLAMLDPSGVEEIRQMTSARGIGVQAYAVAQLRLVYYLERFYNIPRSKRFLRVDDGATRKEERRRYLTPTVHEPADKAVARITSTRQPDDELVFLDQVIREKGPGSGSDFDIDVTFEDDERVCDAQLQTIDVALRSLAVAPSRSAVLQTIVRPLCPETSLTVVFMPRGELGVASAAWGTDVTPPKVSALVVPLNIESFLQRAFDNNVVVSGPLDEDDLQQMIAVYLHAKPPAHACVAPVSAGGRVVNLICAQTMTAFPPGFATILGRLAQAATTAYDRLLGELTGAFKI